MPEPGAGPGPRSAMLDEPPSQPPGTPKKADRSSLVENQIKQQQSSSGIGADASNPQVMIIQTMGEILARFQRLSALLPAGAPAFSQIGQSLQQAIPQMMADQLAGTDQTGAGVPSQGAPAPPPPSAPPSAPPMAGGPPSMSGAPVASPTPAGVMM